ncbi:MAG: hypothetical protein JWR29_2180 [Tardiphaga sp.]|nr:hypothetical protein [Tardiphaga sp.]
MAAFAYVVVEKPSHSRILATSITSTTEELNIPSIAQILKLLSYLRPNILVARMQFSQMPIEIINLFERKFALSQSLDAFHDVEQPSASRLCFFAKKQSILPVSQDVVLRPNDAMFDDMKLAGIWDSLQ